MKILEVAMWQSDGWAQSQTFVWSDSTRQKRGLESDAKQSARKEKPRNNGFANLLAMAVQTFIKSHVPVLRVPKVQMFATLAVAAALFESMAWM